MRYSEPMKSPLREILFVSGLMGTIFGLGILSLFYPAFRTVFMIVMAFIIMGTLLVTNRILSGLEKYTRPFRTRTDIDKALDSLLTDIETLQKTYSADRGRLTSVWQRGKAERRGELIAHLNTEMTQVVQMIKLRSEAQSTEEAHRAAVALQKLMHDNAKAVLEVASSQGMDAETYKKKLLTQIEYDEKIKAGVMAQLLDARAELKRLQSEQAPAHQIKACKDYIRSLESGHLQKNNR